METPLLSFPPLLKGSFIKRYKRFFADVRLESGEVITAHCANSGRMTSCIGENWPALVSVADNPARKLKYTLECTQAPSGSWIVANTQWANHLAEWAVTRDLIPELKGYDDLKREVKYGHNSRIDLLLERPEQKCWVEVKSVTLIDSKDHHAFPDAPTERGRKHLLELARQVENGDRAVMLFLAMRDDGNEFRPAKDIDPAYDDLLKTVAQKGVELLAYQASVTPTGLSIRKKCRIDLS